jgi:nicotinamidase-related amidase
MNGDHRDVQNGALSASRRLDATGCDEADPTAPEFDFAALITIDVQCDTLDGGPLYVPGTSACLPNIARLCEAFRRVGRPIVHVLRLYEPDGSNAELCRKPAVQGAVPVLRPGTPGRRIAPAIVPPGAPDLDDESLLRAEPQRLGKNEIALYKPRWGAFYGTALDVHLRRLGVTTIVFVGCNFPNCPRTSIYEAGERDYRIVLVEDAVSGLYERGERELRNIGVHLHSTERMIAFVERAQLCG